MLAPMVIAELESPTSCQFSLMSPGSEVSDRVLTASPTVAPRSHDRVRDDIIVWTVAHELRQPLSALTTAVAVMQHESQSEASAQAIAIMGRQLGQMARMVDDLLDAHRLSSGKVSLIPARLDIRDVMADVAADSAPAISNRGQRLEVRWGAGPLWVTGDTHRLYQVFSNLLQNAIKFTDDGGLIIFAADGHDSRISIRVRDTGRGIEWQALSRIFDIFTQVCPLGFGGVGIGLSVAREIVSLHHGRIEARSEGLGKGSEFVVTLPAAPGLHFATDRLPQALRLENA